MHIDALSDEQLWRASRAGDRDAFGRIVTRYQSLVCALAYSNTGNLAGSQDLAQETFVAAWRRLGELREPAKLRQWLCGIVRNLSANAVRRDLRRGGAPAALDDIAEPAAPGNDPEALAVSRSEEALLWRALADLPEHYREPLVLFYREEQSLTEVASQLDLSEDAVKQRLSRGRAMLRDEMTAVVERTLTRTRPTGAFTAAVLGAIALATPSQAAAAGLALSGGAAAGKTVLGGIGGAAVLGPVGGFTAAWAASRIVGMNARSPQERAVVARGFRSAIVFCIAMVACLLGAIVLGRSVVNPPALAIVLGTFGWTTLLLSGIAVISTRLQRQIAGIRHATGTGDAAYETELARRGIAASGPTRRESSARLFGVRLFSYASGGLDAGSFRSRAAVGWIAIGDVAVSPLIAIGGLSIAPIAIGGATIGVLSLSIGGLAVGVLALGSLAAGWWAIGASALAWKGAAGAAAVAHDYAVGAVASAIHANDAVAIAWFKSQWFTAPSAIFLGPVVPVLIVASIVVPLGLLARRAWMLRRDPTRRP